VRLGIVASRFNEALCAPLLERAKAEAAKLGLRDVVVHSVPGARGVMDVALEFGIPVANGILTTDTEAQAEARLDKGAEAVRVAVEMARLRAAIPGAAR